MSVAIGNLSIGASALLHLKQNSKPTKHFYFAHGKSAGKDENGDSQCGSEPAQPGQEANFLQFKRSAPRKKTHCCGRLCKF